MRFDPETGDNIYEVPKELSPVIELLTERHNEAQQAFLDIWRLTRRYDGRLGQQIRELVPGWARPL